MKKLIALIIITLVIIGTLYFYHSKNSGVDIEKYFGEYNYYWVIGNGTMKLVQVHDYYKKGGKCIVKYGVYDLNFFPLYDPRTGSNEHTTTCQQFVKMIHDKLKIDEYYTYTMEEYKNNLPLEDVIRLYGTLGNDEKYVFKPTIPSEYLFTSNSFENITWIPHVDYFAPKTLNGTWITIDGENLTNWWNSLPEYDYKYNSSIKPFVDYVQRLWGHHHEIINYTVFNKTYIALFNYATDDPDIPVKDLNIIAEENEALNISIKVKVGEIDLGFGAKLYIVAFRNPGTPILEVYLYGTVTNTTAWNWEVAKLMLLQGLYPGYDANKYFGGAGGTPRPMLPWYEGFLRHLIDMQDQWKVDRNSMGKAESGRVIHNISRKAGWVLWLWDVSPYQLPVPYGRFIPELVLKDGWGLIPRVHMIFQQPMYIPQDFVASEELYWYLVGRTAFSLAERMSLGVNTTEIGKLKFILDSMPFLKPLDMSKYDPTNPPDVGGTVFWIDYWRYGICIDQAVAMGMIYNYLGNLPVIYIEGSTPPGLSPQYGYEHVVLGIPLLTTLEKSYDWDPEGPLGLYWINGTGSPDSPFPADFDGDGKQDWVFVPVDAAELSLEQIHEWFTNESYGIWGIMYWGGSFGYDSMYLPTDTFTKFIYMDFIRDSGLENYTSRLPSIMHPLPVKMNVKKGIELYPGNDHEYPHKVVKLTWKELMNPNYAMDTQEFGRVYIWKISPKFLPYGLTNESAMYIIRNITTKDPLWYNQNDPNAVTVTPQFIQLLYYDYIHTQWGTYPPLNIPTIPKH